MEKINHPPHYTCREHECIEEMVYVFGAQAVIDFCKCNAWKYRYGEIRLVHKQDNGVAGKFQFASMR